MEVTHSTITESRGHQDGGAIYMDTTNATLQTVHLESNRAGGEGGGIYAYRRSHINASNVRFETNIARERGGGIAIRNDSSLLCYACTILSNQAFSGAGMYAYLSDDTLVVAQLQDSHFENNTAQSHGGGIEFDALVFSWSECSISWITCEHIVLLNTSFEGNSANFSGAIVLSSKLSRVLVDCEYNKGRSLNFLNETHFSSLNGIDSIQPCSSWKKNRASSMGYGDLFGEYGHEGMLNISPSDEVKLVRRNETRYVLENVRGGQQLPTIRITILDEFGKGPAPTSPRLFRAQMFSPNDFFRGEYVTNISAGSGSFSGIVGFVIPGNYTLIVTFSHLDLATLNVSVVVRECQVGEEPTSDNRTCQKCDAFTYNFNASEVGGCKACPDDAHVKAVKKCLVEEACTYQDRTRNLTNFTQVFTNCSMNEATLEAYRAKQCNEGHEGPLCGSCKTSFGLSFRFQCLRCPRNGVVSFLVVLGVTLYLLAVAAFTIKGCLPTDKKKAQNRSIRIPSNASSGASNQDPEVNVEMVRMIVEGHVPPEYFQKRQEEASTSQTPEESSKTENQYDLTKWRTTEVFKIMINFLQTTTVAASLELEWTDRMDGLFEASEFIGAVATSAISGPIDCLASSTSKVMRVVCKMLLNLFVPTFVMFLFAALWGFVALKNGEDMAYFGRRMVLSIIAVTYISYLGLTKVAVRAFYCVDVYDSAKHFESSKTQYLAVDTSIECYKGGHFGLVAIAVIVLGVVTVAFPLVLAVILSRNKQRHMRKDSWTFETAGFLFRTFKESCLFWESIVMFRKACLSVIVVFSYLLEGQSQGILASVVLLICLYAHLTIRPYREDFKTLNHFESASLLVSCLTFTLGLFFSKNSSNESVRAFLSVLIIVTNILFFMFLLSACIICGIGHLRVVLQSENSLLPDQVPWWRVLKIFIITRFRNWFKSSS